MYSINGTFLGFTELKSQLTLCPLSFTQVLNQKKFGTISVSECNLYLADLIGSMNMPEEANILFELFLQDGEGNFIDVPVLIRSYKLVDDSYPNQGITPNENWRLARRFFTIDTMTGIDEVGGI